MQRLRPVRRHTAVVVRLRATLRGALPVLGLCLPGGALSTMEYRAVVRTIVTVTGVIPLGAPGAASATIGRGARSTCWVHSHRTTLGLGG